jgi:hypothetical protein
MTRNRTVTNLLETDFFCCWHCCAGAAASFGKSEGRCTCLALGDALPCTCFENDSFDQQAFCLTSKSQQVSPICYSCFMLHACAQ